MCSTQDTIKMYHEGGDCSDSAEVWVQWQQAFVNIQYGECVEYATVSLSICVLPRGISQSVRRLPDICFCIKSAGLFTLYLFVSAEPVKHEVSKKRPMCVMYRITVTIQAH